MSSANPPVILLVGHVIPYPPAAGNEIRILKMVQWLRTRGFRMVMLLNHDPLPDERLRALRDAVGTVHFANDDYGPLPQAPRRSVSRVMTGVARLLPDSWLYRWAFGAPKQKKLHSDGVKAYLASDRLIQVTKHLCETYQPVAVIAEYIFAAPCLDVVPRNVLRIVDTHDMFSRKAAEVLAYGVDDALVCSRREERHYLLKSDVVIAIQPNEARMFRDLVKSRDVITVGIDFDVVEVNDVPPAPGIILVVGSDNPLNQHGLTAFCREAWPAIRAGHPGAVLRVVGKLAHHLREDDARVQAAGWVADLDEEYRRATVVINPTQAGTGLKIKSVEALCHGKALVGTPNSVDGIETDGEHPYVVCTNWPGFADAVLRLLRSDDERRRLEAAAARFAREHFSAERTYAPLGRRLETLSPAVRN